jgi:hypothetical protein
MLTRSQPLPVKPNNTVGAPYCGFPWYRHRGPFFVQLRIVTRVLLAMPGSATINWVCCQGMFILNVEATRITNIPGVIFLDRGGSIVALGHCRGHRWWVWTMSRLDYSTCDKNYSCSPSRIYKWIGTLSTTAGTMPSLSLRSTPTSALAESSSI